MSECHTWFVTGTDTDAGKTTVARALLHGARAKGIRAAGYKPVESGAAARERGGPDAQALAAAVAGDIQTTYVYQAPVAPLLAARQLGETISLAQIQARAAKLQKDTDLLLVEGAGGLLVPLAPQKTIADLAIAIDQPLLIVAPDTLGAINHSLLTIECARARGLRILALILSEREIDGGRGLGNQAQIEEYGKLPVLCLEHVTAEAGLTRAGKALLEKLLALANAAI